jgi:hypothetical protein
MIKNIIKYTDIFNENTFMGITVPEFEYFKINLVEHIRIGKKGEEEVSREHNFNLKIKSEISKAYKEKLDNDLKNAFKLNWVPFDYHTQQYQYYTSKYITESEKLEKLKNIFEVLKNFEIYYKESVKKSMQLFEKDVFDKKNYVDYEVAVKFNEEKKCFVVVALRFLGERKYSILANASFKKGKISETNYKESGFLNEFINWDKQKKDLYYFEINPESYLEIKNLIEIKEKEKELFQEKQNKILEKIGKNNLAHFDEKNIFDLKVIYNDKLKMFEFYCKGYFEPKKYNYKKPNRTLISFLAVNYILSRELSDKEIEDNFTILENGTYKENNFVNDIDLEYIGSKRYKYNLKIQEESSLKDKKLYLSLEYNDVLKEIIANYEKHKEFFTRKVKNIKIKTYNSLSFSKCINKKFPSIYFNDDGRCFYVLSIREMFEILPELPKNILNQEKNENENIVLKKVNEGKSVSFYIKAIEISHEEAIHHLYENPWKLEIERNSIYLNTELWMNDENKTQLSNEDRKKSFNILLLNNKLQSESKKNQELKTKIKKIKL